jgi:SAM-dependent methyltransferase
MIDVARQRFAGHERVQFHGDAQRLSFPDGFFDTLVCMGVVDRLPNFTAAIQEMTRVVNKGGTLLIAFPNLLSPYSAWKGLVFYPAVALLRPLYYFLMRQPCPPAIPVSIPHLCIARGASRLLTSHGTQVEAIVYYNFNVLLAPLDEWLPHRTVRWIESLERLRNGPLRWLGSGFILKARKVV